MLAEDDEVPPAEIRSTPTRFRGPRVERAATSSSLAAAVYEDIISIRADDTIAERTLLRYGILKAPLLAVASPTVGDLLRVAFERRASMRCHAQSLRGRCIHGLRPRRGWQRAGTASARLDEPVEQGPLHVEAMQVVGKRMMEVTAVVRPEA